MHIKKLILLLFLAPVLVQAQKTTGPNYTYIAQRYEWIAGMFKALGIPAGDSAQFQTGQEVRAGALYYDSVGVDSGLYVWSGLAWRNHDPATLTASQGIIKVGSDFQLGGTVTSDRLITINNGSFRLNTSNTASADYMFLSTDTVNSPDLDAAIPFAGFLNKRTLQFPSHSTTTYRAGAQLNLNYQIKDSATINTIGGDFAMANKTTMVLEKMSGYSGRSVYVGGTAATLSEGVPVQLNDLTLQHTTSTISNYRYAKNYWVGTRSYLVIGQNDTLQNWVGFHNMGFNQGGRVDYAFDFVGGHFGNQSVARVTNPWFLFGHSTRSKSLIAGPTGFGDSTIEASALIDASSTTKGVIWPRMTTTQKNAIASPATGLIVFDTDLVQYNFWDGDSWEAMGGGGGTPTFQQVLTAGSTLTGNNTINNDYVLSMTGNSAVAFGDLFSVTNSSTTGRAINAASAGTNFTIQAVNTKTSSGGGGAIWGASQGSSATASLNRDSSSTATVIKVLDVTRTTSGSAANGIGGAIHFNVENQSGLGFFANSVESIWKNSVDANKESFLRVRGLDNAVEEVFMDVEKDGIVIVNAGADTLSTKAYARSVGGGGGGANTALSNLAAVAINESLISDANNTDDLGSTSLAWKDIYSYTNRLKGSTSGETILQAAAVAGAGTLTLPTGTATLAQITNAQTFSNSQTFSGPLISSGGTQITGTFGGTPIGSGSIEMFYSAGAGTIQTYNRSGVAYTPMNVVGSTVTVKNETNTIGVFASTGLTLSRALATPITSTAIDVTLSSLHYTMKVDASGAARTITLPAASGATGRIYVVKKTDATANTVTIDGNASETIDGATTKVISTQYAGFTIQSDGANWMIIGAF